VPNVKSAEKRMRTNEARRARNRRDRSRLRTAVKRVREPGDSSATAEDLRRAISLLDRSARKGLIHPNKAARDKSRLTRLLRKQEGGAGA
jgi:small subunit ribosomal protein S20